MAPRLYLITPPVADPALRDSLAALLDVGGIACVRLAIGGDEGVIRRTADALRPVCATRDVPLVIADHVRLVRPHGLDGVHLTDGSAASVRSARAALGPDLIVGALGGTTRHRAMLAAEAGADYVSLGPVHAGGLGGGEEAGADLFAWWDDMIETPSVAEGGLAVADAQALRADFFAPRLSIWQHPAGPLAGLAAWRRALGEP